MRLIGGLSFSSSSGYTRFLLFMLLISAHACSLGVAARIHGCLSTFYEGGSGALFCWTRSLWKDKWLCQVFYRMFTLHSFSECGLAFVHYGFWILLSFQIIRRGILAIECVFCAFVDSLIASSYCHYNMESNIVLYGLSEMLLLCWYLFQR